MPKAIQSQWNGGHADDIRTTNTNQCEYSLNFDLYTDPHRLLPIRDSVDETADSGTMSEVELSDVVTSVVSGNSYLTAFGYSTGASQVPAAYTRSSGMNGVWSKQATGTGTFIKGTAVTYSGTAYCLSYNGTTQYTLWKYVGAGSLTNIGTVTVTTSPGTAVPRPFVHPSDKKLYFIIGSYIAQYDGSTLSYYTSGISLKLPTGFYGTGLTDNGDYLAIAMKDIQGVGNSVVYLWDRQLTLIDANSVVDFGEGDLNAIENIENSIVGLVYPKYFAGYTSVITNKVDIRVWSGGAVQTIKSVDLGSQSNYNYLKLKKDGKLYFGTAFTETNIWCVYKNRAGYWTVNKERYLTDGDTATANAIQQIYGLNAVGDYFYIATVDNSGVSYLRATSTSSSDYGDTSIYRTTINPGMPLADRNRKKQLKNFKIYFKGATSGTVAVKYLVDGKNSGNTTTFETVISESTTNIDTYINATQLADNQAFAAGVEYQFQLESTSNVKIKSIEYEYDNLND